MVDGTRILANVKAWNIPPACRVLRGRRWRALRYSLFAAVFLVVTLLDLDSNADSLHLPAPVGTLFRNGPLLSALALIITAVAVIRPFLESRTHVVVLLPDGFVYGNIRSGKLYRCATYAAMTDVKLGTSDLGGAGLFTRPYLSWSDQQGKKITWTIPGYFTVTAMQLAALILIQHTQTQGLAGDGAQDSSPQSVVRTAEVVALARNNQTPASWCVIKINRRPTRWLRWSVRYIVFPILVAFMALLLVGVGGICYEVVGALFIHGFVGSTTTLAIASFIAPAAFFLPLMTILFVYSLYLIRALSVYRRITVITRDGLVVGDRYTGAVLNDFAWRDVANLHVWHFANMSFLRFRLGKRKSVTLAFFWLSNPYYTQPTGQIVQTMIERFAQSRPIATAA